MFGFNNTLTAESAILLTEYLAKTHQFEEAISLGKKILHDCDCIDQEIDIKAVLYIHLVYAIWGEGKFHEAEMLSKKALKFAKKKRLKSVNDHFKRSLKAIRKKKAMPLEKVKGAVMSKKEYRKMRNFSESRACALCGKHDGRLLQCSGCESVSYCSKEHQKADWKSHKKLCRNTSNQK